jgi:hypothetical protein
MKPEDLYAARSSGGAARDDAQALSFVLAEHSGRFC